MQEAPEKAAGPLFRIVKVCGVWGGQPRFAGPCFVGPFAQGTICECRGAQCVKPHIVYKLCQDMVYKKEGVPTVQN